MNILIIGSTGMAGHVIYKYLEKDSKLKLYNFANSTKLTNDTQLLDLSKNFIELEKKLDKLSLDIIINCAGILNENTLRNSYAAIMINSLLPKFLEKKYINSTTKIIQLSTDCVFSGRDGDYSEKDFRDGESLYARTKVLGEIENKKDLTIRTSIIGPDMRYDGIGLFNWFMKQNGTIRGYKNSIWTGVTTIELAKFIKNILGHNISGIYHLVSEEQINKHDLIILFKKVFQKENIIIHPYENKYSNKSLINTRKEIDYIVPSYLEMLKEMKIWMMENKQLYNYY